MKSLYDSLNLPDPATPDAPVELLVKLTGKSFSKAVVESPEYRRSIVRRVLTDNLAPAVECRLLDHAYGKPVDRVEIDDKRPENLTAEKIRERAIYLATLADEVAAQERMNDVVPGSSSDELDDGVEPTSIH